MAQINKPNLYFNTVLYTGDLQDSDGTGHTQSITGVGFQPDWVWHKGRSNARTHILVDSVRGTTNYNWLITNSTSPEITANTNGAIKSIDSDGITLENGTDSSSKSNNAGANGETYVFWNWLGANGTASNTDGSITSTVSANTTSGFSIVSYTGNGTAGATIGHGLGSVPKMIIVKKRSGTSSWPVYNENIGNANGLFLNGTSGTSSEPAFWNSTSPTSSVFSVGTSGDTNGSGATEIAYCFAEKKGFSKAFSYTGNGSTDGSFIYCGFRPAFVMIKRTDSTSDWVMLDNKRDSFNLMNKKLFPNNSDSEYSGQNACDFLSNGFKLRDNATNNFATNISGATYIGIAFAESPLVGTNNTPATAR